MNRRAFLRGASSAALALAATPLLPAGPIRAVLDIETRGPMVTPFASFMFYCLQDVQRIMELRYEDAPLFTVNLEDAKLRSYLKSFSNKPTIPTRLNKGLGANPICEHDGDLNAAR